MKLGVDIRALADEPMTGIGTYVYEMLHALVPLQSSRGVYITPWYSGSTGVHRAIQGRIAPLRLSAKWLKGSNKLLSAAYLASLQLPPARDLAWADYWWMPHINFIPVSLTRRFALTVHDLSFMHMPKLYSPKRRIWHKLLRVSSLLNRADALIAVSEATRQELLHFFPLLASKPLKVIYPGADHSSFEDASQMSSLPSEYILFLGTLEPRKNVNAVLSAFELLNDKHPELELILAGSQGWSSSPLRARIRDTRKVRWFSYVPPSQKAELLRGARILIWPSFYEGFGFPPLEALRENTPVITSYRTSLPEVLCENAYYVNPYNYVEIAELADYLLTTSAQATQQRPNAFTWGKSASELLTFICERYAHRN